MDRSHSFYFPANNYFDNGRKYLVSFPLTSFHWITIAADEGERVESFHLMTMFDVSGRALK